MVEATVSMVLKRLAPMIEKTVREEVCMLINSTDEASKLSSKLQKIQQVLRDAERKGVTDPKVRSWMNKLQDISYEIDDVLDEWDWQNIKLKMDELEDGSETSSSPDPWEKVSSFLQSVCLCFRQVVERRSISLNIKQLNERLDSIGQQNEDEFKFIPNLSHDSQEFRRISSTSFVDVGEVCGRDRDKEVVVSKLLSESSSQIENISIVGAGGMGKTTLAQIAFNDDRIKDNFQLKIWVCVSHPFDEIKIAKAILEALNKSTPNLSQFETLLQCIRDAISGKKFLLVLDDVWTEDDTMWKPLKICLNKYGSPGSKILVTTRNTKVAQVMGSTQMQIHWLNPLSDSDCWSILSQIAFHGRTEWDRDILKETGLKIVKKCKGLPLATKAIGSLLRFKNSLEEWKNVLESEMWELEKARTDIFPFLVMSYDELHPVAKRCFSYCAIFPKDMLIRVERLVRMWWAQGFLSSSNGGSDDAELKGREIFDDLAMRSFFQDFRKDYLGNHIIGCKMHDIVHDFAQFLTENECLIVENDDVGEKLANVPNARHLNLRLDKVEADKKPIPIYHDKCRSFLSKNYDIPENLVGRLKRVRVLILYYRGLKGIPKEIGSLIHLRYLDLSGNCIKELPETICDLYNLQTLILERCFNLFRLPEGIHKLQNLRHLLTFGTELEFPQGMDELTNLWTLNYIFASMKNLVLLRNLNQLHGSLRIVVEHLAEADDVVAAEKADLKSKNFIRELRLYCEGETKSQVIEALQPHPKLQILEYYTSTFYIPKWITTLTNLRKLTIGRVPFRRSDGYYLPNGSSSLPALGNLSVLEDLCLHNMHGMERLSREFLGIDLTSTTRPTEFPRLKRLSFSSWKDWEEWEDISEEEENNINISIFPCLQLLEFQGCPKLKTLPHRLLRKASSLTHVTMEKCNNLCIRYGNLDGVSGSRKTSHIPISYFRQV